MSLHVTSTATSTPGTPAATANGALVTGTVSTGLASDGPLPDNVLAPLPAPLVPWATPALADEHPALGTQAAIPVPLHVFNTHLEADDAVRKLHHAGYDVTKLSLIGRGYHTEEHPAGFYTTGDRVRSWGGAGAFWGGIWGLLLVPGVFLLPGLGLVAMAGPVVAALVSGLEGALVVGGLSALGAALTRIGVPADSVLKYETALKAEKYVLAVHGTPSELALAWQVLAAHPEAETLNV